LYQWFCPEGNPKPSNAQHWQVIGSVTYGYYLLQINSLVMR